MEIRIDKEFESLIPPLSSDEFQQLEENVRKEGIRDPLVVWDGPEGYGILLDGHNRYKIANKYNIPYATKRMHFSDRGKAMEWMIDNQLGRRNLHVLDREALMNKKREVVEKEAKKRMLSGSKNNPMEKLPQGTTRDIIGKDLGVSGRQVDKLHTINEKASEKTKQLVREGKLSINQAYNSVHPKKPDPVKVAKEEHQQFQEQKAAAMVDFNDAQIDKINQRIINNAMVQDIMKLNSTIQKFALEHNTSDIHDLADEFTTEYRNELLKNLQKSTSVLEILANAIRR
jgi:ParB-like chromosome segregation protein Spo0J